MHFWDTLAQTASELEKRGFERDDVMAPTMVGLSILHRGMAAEQAAEGDREKFYQPLGQSYSERRKHQPDDAITTTLRETLEALAEHSTPSIALDAIARLHEAEPDNKQYKKLVKQAKRHFHPLYRREAYSQLTELGKDAANRLGIYNPIELLLYVARQQSELIDQKP